MKVAELKRFLEGVPDDTQVVLSGSDHSFFVNPKARVVKSEKRGSYLFEWYGPESRIYPDSDVVSVLWIGG